MPCAAVGNVTIVNEAIVPSTSEPGIGPMKLLVTSSVPVKVNALATGASLVPVTFTIKFAVLVRPAASFMV